jgi:hypothetical protein
VILIVPLYGDLSSVTYHIKASLEIASGLDPEVINHMQMSDKMPIDDELDAIQSNLDLF